MQCQVSKWASFMGLRSFEKIELQITYTSVWYSTTLHDNPMAKNYFIAVLTLLRIWWQIHGKYVANQFAMHFLRGSQCIRREFADLSKCSAIEWWLHDEPINLYHCEKIAACTVKAMAEFRYIFDKTIEY